MSRFTIIFVHVDVQLFQYHLLKTLFLLYFNAFAHLSDKSPIYFWFCLWAFYFVPLNYLSSLSPITLS